MGKIGDLWVRLGLKKSEYDKGFDDAGTRAKTFEKALGKLKAAGIAAFAAIGLAAAAAFKDIVIQSNKLGDEWRGTLGGMQNAWNAFTNSLLSWDWEGFWDRVRGAYKAGKSLAGASDALTEQMNSLRMRRADMEQENARLRIAMQDQNKSYKERAAAAQAYLDNVKPLYEEEATIMRRYLKEVEASWLKAAGLDTNSVTFQALETFLKNGAKLTESMANDPNMVKIANMYQSMGDEINNRVADAYINAKNAAGAFEAENRRVFQSLNTATAMGGGGSTSGTSGKDVAQRIAQRAKEASQGEIVTLLEKYKTEKALLVQFGMDTEQLTEEYNKNVQAIIEKYLGKIKVDIEAFEPVEIEPIEIDEDELQRLMDGITDQLTAANDRAIELGMEFHDAIIDGYSRGIQELTDQLFGLQDANPGAVFQALMEPLADMAVREGEIVMAAGLGVEAIKTSLESLQGTAAIVAGATLIAIGAAAKSGLKALASGGSNTTANYSGTGSGVGTQTIRSELTVKVEGIVRGRDIVLSGQNTINDYNR